MESTCVGNHLVDKLERKHLLNSITTYAYSLFALILKSDAFGILTTSTNICAYMNDPVNFSDKWVNSADDYDTLRCHIEACALTSNSALNVFCSLDVS